MSQASNELLKNLEFCVFDLETTGGNQKSDKIIEIGLVKIRNLKIVDNKGMLINPEIKIPEFIQKLTSISQSDVEDAPTIEEAIDEIIDFMGDSILVAHNTSFDVPFFNSVLKRLKRSQMENKSICTNLMTKYLIPGLMNSNLNYMCQIFHIEHNQAHRALDDAMATSELLLKFLNIYIEKDINKLNHLYYPKNKYELDRINFKFKKDEEYKNTNKQIIDKIKNIKFPFLISIKGNNGVLDFSFPSLNTEKEAQFIIKHLESIEWKTATIRIFGTFLEAFTHFSPGFQKLSPELREDIVNILWDTHIPKDSELKKGEENFNDNKISDFVITHHIVPQQYIIYPTNTLTHKNELIFRYPTQRKKLIQFINSKANKISSKKLSNLLPQELQNFINNYLVHSKNISIPLLHFNKSLPQKRLKDFYKQIEQFLKEYPNPYKYPADHI